MGCPLSTPTPDEVHPILAALSLLEAETGCPVDGEQLASLLHLRGAWGPRWRQRLGSLLRGWEREGRVRRAEAKPWAKRPGGGTGMPAGWSAQAKGRGRGRARRQSSKTAQTLAQNVDAHKGPSSRRAA